MWRSGRAAVCSRSRFEQGRELGCAKKQHERLALGEGTKPEPCVEGLRALVNGLHDDGARPDQIGRGVRTLGCVDEQVRAEMPALIAGVDRELPE